MTAIFSKLNLKMQREILVVDPPASFEPELAGLPDVVVVRDPGRVARTSFALMFATRQADVDALSAAVLDKLEGDAILWIAYPKRTSRQYRCDFDRDSG